MYINTYNTCLYIICDAFVPFVWIIIAREDSPKFSFLIVYQMIFFVVIMLRGYNCIYP